MEERCGGRARREGPPISTLNLEQFEQMTVITERNDSLVAFRVIHASAPRSGRLQLALRPARSLSRAGRADLNLRSSATFRD